MSTTLNNLYLPAPPTPNTTPFELDHTLYVDDFANLRNQNRTEIAIIFEIPRTGTLEKVEFLTGQLAAGTVRVSFQDVSSSTGNPDGTVDQFTNVTVSPNTWTRPSIVSSNGTNGGVKRSVSRGEILSVVWDHPTDNNDIVQICTIASTEFQTSANFPYTATRTNGTWIKDITKIPIMALQYSDKTYEYVHGTYPVKQLHDVSFTTSSLPNERGLIFQVPAPISVSGMWFYGVLTTGSTINATLYDNNNNALVSTSIATDKISDTTKKKYTESFDKANSTTLGPDLTWTEITGNTEIFGNRVKSADSLLAVARAEQDVTTPNMFVEVSMYDLAGDSQVGITARNSSSQTYYEGFRTTTTRGFAKVVSSVRTVLAEHTGLQAPSNGTTLGLSVSTNNVLLGGAFGSTLNLYEAGVLVLSITDSSILENKKAGILVKGSASIDNFRLIDTAANTSHFHNLLFGSSQVLFPDVNYRLAITPTSGTINLEHFSVNTDSDGTYRIMSAAPVSSTWHLTTRTGSGAWTNDKGSRPWIGLVFDSIPAAAGLHELETSLSIATTLTTSAILTKRINAQITSLATSIASIVATRNLASSPSSITTLTAAARGGISSVTQFVLPTPPATTNSTNIPLISSGSNSGLLDATGKRIAHILQAPKTGVIETIEFYCGPATLTGTLRVSFQDVSATNGNPDGTQDQYVNVTSLSPNSWNTIGNLTNLAETWTAHSVEAITWKYISWSPELQLFAAAVVGSNIRIMTSPDGKTWTNRPVSPTTVSLESIAWSPELNLFVGVGGNGNGGSDFARVVTSSDGITWTVREAASGNIWRSITWSPELAIFVAVGEAGGVMTSPNGIDWTSRTASQANLWTGVTWSPELGLFVAVASSGANRVMTSPDGTNWTSRSIESNSWTGVTWSPELALFVAVGTNLGPAVATSPDGTTWTSRSADANGWRSIVWASELGIFVAVANTGTNRVMTSSDGITWTGRTAAQANDWTSVAWSPELSRLVAVASSGSSRVMICDAKRYVTRGDVLSVVWQYQSFNSGNQVGIGFYEGSTSNLVNFPYRAHFNGSTWTKVNSPTEMVLVYSDGSYVVPDGSYTRSFADSINFNSGSNPNERGMRFQFPVTVSVSGCWILLARSAEVDIKVYDANNNTLATVALDPDLQLTNSGDYHQILFSTPLIFRADRTYRIAVKPTTNSNITFYEAVFASSELRKASPPNNLDWYSTTRLNSGVWTDSSTKKPWIGFFIAGIEEN